MCYDEQLTKFSLMDRNMYVSLNLEEVDGKVAVRHRTTHELITVTWIGKGPEIDASSEGDMKNKYLITSVKQQKLAEEDLIDGAVTIVEQTFDGEFTGKSFTFKNPKLETKIIVKCILLYGTKYRPVNWLSEPRDEEMWHNDEESEVIKVTQGHGYRIERVDDPDGHFMGETAIKDFNNEEWVVELDNGASFVNMKQGRNYPRPSAAILSLAWLGQAYEAEFW